MALEMGKSDGAVYLAGDLPDWDENLLTFAGIEKRGAMTVNCG